MTSADMENTQPTNAGNDDTRVTGVDPQGNPHALNRVLPFTVEDLDLRGKAVTLSSEFDAIVRRHGYPDEINRALGEAVALTALLGTTLKFDGKFILQTQSDENGGTSVRALALKCILRNGLGRSSSPICLK